MVSLLSEERFFFAGQHYLVAGQRGVKVENEVFLAPCQVDAQKGA